MPNKYSYILILLSIFSLNSYADKEKILFRQAQVVFKDMLKIK